MLKARDVLEHLSLFGLLSAIILPPVYLPGYHLYLVTILSPVIFILFLGLSRGKVLLTNGLLEVSGICFVGLLSILNSYANLNVPRNTSDYIELIKFLQFIPYLLAAQCFRPDTFEIKCRRYLTFGTFVFVVVGIIQVLDLKPVVTVLGSLYGSSDQLATKHIGGRILITGSDPNISGAIGLLFAGYNYFLFATNRKFKYLMLSFVCLCLILMTQSRTVLAGLGFAALLYGMLFSNSRFIVRISAVTFIVLLLLVLVIYFQLEYITIGLQTAKAGHNKSLNVRLANILYAMDLFRQSPILGWGPAKSIHPTIIDSEYALILERYGALGVIAFASYIIRQFRLGLKLVKYGAGAGLFGRLSAFYVLFCVLFMTTNNVFSGYQLMAVLVLLMCVTAAEWLAMMQQVSRQPIDTADLHVS